MPVDIKMHRDLVGQFVPDKSQVNTGNKDDQPYQPVE
jgi:hypothetical protein